MTSLQRLRAKRHATGRCIDCPTPIGGRYLRCAPCRVKAAAGAARSRQRRLATAALIVLSLLAPVGVSAQTLTERVDAALVELTAARALLPPAGPVYTGLTDHSVHVKPAPLTLSTAPFAFTDPTFGTPIIRVTDVFTSNGSPMRLASSAHATVWNSNGTMFYTQNYGGGDTFFGYNGTTVTKLPYTISSQLEPQFSFDHPDLIYGVQGHQIKTWTVSTGQSSIQLDLDNAYAGLPLSNTYVGGILLADHDIWAAHFGGAGIDQHVFVHHSGLGGLLDVRGLGWFIHAISLDRTGRYVFVYPANNPNTGQLPGCPSACIAQVFIWDTTLHTLTPQTVRPAGHGVMGYVRWINQDCCTSTPWDSAQWQDRLITDTATTRDLIPSPLTPQHVYVSEHTNWRAALPGSNVPVISCNYRFGDGLSQTLYPWRAWDQECIAISTTGNGVVHRLLHHQSEACTAAGCEFWPQPIPNVSPNGCGLLFTSDWGKTLGPDRQDVFLAKIC